jgi:hypothetical protein
VQLKWAFNIIMSHEPNNQGGPIDYTELLNWERYVWDCNGENGN